MNSTEDPITNSSGTLHDNGDPGEVPYGQAACAGVYPSVSEMLQGGTPKPVLSPDQWAALEAKVEADAPHARFGRAITRTDGDLLVKQVADLIHQAGGPRITQNTLFAWLRDHGRLWNALTA